MIKSATRVSIALIILVAAAECTFAASPGPFDRKQKVNETITPQMLTPRQNALIDQAIVREKEVTRTIRQRAPVVETYIQNMRPDSVSGQVPASDQRFIGRVQFGKIIGDSSYKESDNSTGVHKTGRLAALHQPSSVLDAIGSSLKLQFHDEGFVQMLLIDSNDFDRQHYKFGFVRAEFVGSVPTQVFDVAPIPQGIGPATLGMKKTVGRFLGRIWVETRTGSVVRFNGDFAGSRKGADEFYHFDSWRTNVEPTLWLPTSIYIEQTDRKSLARTLKFKAISHIWGYSLRVPQTDAESTSMEVVGATDLSNDTPELSPLGAQRLWVQQSEDNVVERLFTSGLLDAPSEFDKTLEALAANILAYNNIPVARPIRCRTLLTDSLESMAVGNTIILSKGLVDTTAVLTESGLQQTGNLNAVLAFQLAHILLGHRLDTRFAFTDELLFSSTEVLRHVPMHHSEGDNIAAAKKATELLEATELASSQQYFGLYLQQLQQRLGGLQALNEPLLGDGLTRSSKDRTFWMAALLPKGIKLNEQDPKQQAAMPLSSFLRVEPATDSLAVKHTAFEPVLSAADKLPFEIEPIYLKLNYLKPRPDSPGDTSGDAASALPTP